MVRESLGGSKILLGSPRGPGYFHNDTELLFDSFILILSRMHREFSGGNRLNAEADLSEYPVDFP